MKALIVRGACECGGGDDVRKGRRHRVGRSNECGVGSTVRNGEETLGAFE